MSQDYGYYGPSDVETEAYLGMDETGEVYVEAVEYAGELMSYVYGEAAERWASKGKGEGKRPKGKGKAKGKDGAPAKGG